MSSINLVIIVITLIVIIMCTQVLWLIVYEIFWFIYGLILLLVNTIKDNNMEAFFCTLIIFTLIVIFFW